jgi:predicted dehydrogenase
MEANKTIKLGVIGTGNIGNVHLENFKDLPNAEIIAVTDLITARAEKAAEEFGIKKIHTSAQALIQDDQIDAVIVGVPNQFHASITVEALKAGKHVLLEKPMAINLEEAKEIVRAQKQYKKIVMIPHQMRWHWAAMQTKEQIDKGVLGEIYNVKTGWFRRKGIPGWGTWFTQSNQSGGGPLIDIGVHMLDLALYLMGNPKPVSVYGSTYAEFGPKKRGIGTWGTPDWEGVYDVEDLATALIKMEDGSTLSLEVSWAVNMDTSNEPFVHIMGTDGGASLDGTGGKILQEIDDKAIDTELSKPENDEGERKRLSRYFIECVLENKEPISNVMTGLANNLILDAIYESSRTGREVQINWDL